MLGSFTTEELAKKAIEVTAKQSITAYYKKSDNGNYRLLTGKFQEKAKADSLKTFLSNRFNKEYWVFKVLD